MTENCLVSFDLHLTVPQESSGCVVEYVGQAPYTLAAPLQELTASLVNLVMSC